MANFYGAVVTLVTVWTVLNKPGEVQGQLSLCSGSEQQQCRNNTQFIPTRGLSCFSNGTGQNNVICNCGTVPDTNLLVNAGIDINIGRLCTTAIPSSIPLTSLQTCYGCAQNYFTSINYPELYETGRGEVYLLYIPGAREINFKFSAPFSVETKKDDLFVGAGLEFSAADVKHNQTRGVISENSLYYFDNRTIPRARETPDPFNITGDTAWLYFRTDRNIEQVGFNLTWSFVAVDTDPPVPTCPKNISRGVPPGTNGINVIFNEPFANDEVDGPATVTSRSHFSNQSFPVGTTRVTYVFSDRSNNVASCSFYVIVFIEDNTPPVVQCGPDITETIPLFTGGLQIHFPDCTATDDSGSAILVSRTHNPGDFFTIGSVIVTYTFTDSSGNRGLGSFRITVVEEDNTSPVVQCGPDITETIPLFTGGLLINFLDCTATDDSGSAIFVSRTHNPGHFFITGSTIVTYTFTDSSGNRGFGSFRITVVEEDNTPPVVLCGPDITETIPLFTGGLLINFPDCTATDDSGSAIFVSRTHNPGDFFISGSTIVTYTFTDSSGNRGFGSFRITVVEEDNTSPVVQCGPDITETIPLFTGGLLINFPNCTATDDSGSAIFVSRTHNPGHFFITGSTIVTYTFTDSSGNRGFGSFRITVVEEDNTPPVVQCGPDITETIPLFTGGLLINFPDCTATDDSGSAIFVSRTHNPGDFFTIGLVVVTYTFTDSSGNRGLGSFRITVVEADTDPPMLLCPGNIVLTVLSSGKLKPIRWPLPIVSDISEPVRLVSASHNPGDKFPVGNTTVRYEYADACGNTASCTFDIRIMIDSPCDNVNPCNNGGTCVAVDLDTTSCICTRCFTGDFCQTAVDVCSGNMCDLGSTCVPVPGSCEQYTCSCPPCFTGPFCSFAADVCAGNECNNGGVCQADANDCTRYTCICPACFSGPFCQFRANGCSPNHCQNNAVCTDLSAIECNAYRCDCDGCFEGFNCERAVNGCLPNPCQNNGVCTDLSATACNAYRCDCVGCFDGFNCDIAIPNPCNQNPCLNGGTCTRNSQFCASYTCQCPPRFDGDNCEDPVEPSFNPCNSFPCENGGSCCSQESDTDYVCVCPPEYAGINCGLIAASGANPCLSNPCQNGGSCFASYYSGSSSFMYTPQYMCLCTAGFTGFNCQFNVSAVPSQDVCGMEPGVCQNGGICTNTFNSFTGDVDFKCTNCLAFAVGKTCEVIVPDPCISSPCINGGTCVIESGGFMCSCTSAFQGTYCHIPGRDFEPPVISGCPEDVSEMGPSPVNFTPPQATDNSGYVRLLFMSHTPGQEFPIGITTVSFVFGDAAGNQNQCTFYVTISDGGLPFYIVVSNCPGNIVAQTSGSSANVMFGTPTAMSRDGGVSLVSQSHNSSSSFPVGTTTPVSFIFRDTAGNQAECNFDVTVTTAVTDDPCFPSPCENDGTCVRTGVNNFVCLCLSGFTGALCEQGTIVPCISSPCENNGICVPIGVNNFVCVCLPGFTGTVCEQGPGLTVDSSLCQNRAVTIPPLHTFVEESVIVPNATTFNGTIVPPTGFDGDVISLSTTNYFLSEGSSRFIYIYEFGGFNATCDFTIFAIASSQVGKRSVDEKEMFEEVSLCNPNPCLNEGQCHLLLNEDDTTPVPYCECVEGWSGPTCATRVSYVSQFHEIVEMWTFLVILVMVMLIFALMVCQYQRRWFQGRRYQDEKAVIQPFLLAM